MKNPNIAAILKYYRKLNQLSVNQVAEVLKENHNYVAPKTIYGWESGQTQPDADTLMFLCELYKIDNILETFGYRNTAEAELTAFTELEKQLILRYRESPQLRHAIHKLLDLEVEKD